MAGAWDDAATPADKPLSRVKVLDLTLARAGPTCVRHLADWGANVIRIEPPAADAGNDAVGGSRHGPDFQNLHRNKRAMTLNLKDPEGHAIFMKLAAEADVIVENMRSTVKTRLGIDYDAIRKINPRIVYGSISGFGQDGPYAARAGVDQIAQGMGGLMSITGLPGQGPVRVGVPISDLCAGGYLAMGIMMALFDREKTGEGKWVTTSLLEAMIAMLDFQGSRWTMAGEVAEQAGNDHPTGIPTGVFPTSDGHINIAASGQRLWTRFAEAIGIGHLIDDPRFVEGNGRSDNRVELNALIGEVTATKPSQHWIDLLMEAGVPCGPINSIDQTFADPQVKHLGMQKPVQHGEMGQINIVASPLQMTGQDREIRRPAPDRGEHTDEVLSGLGYDAAAIAALKDRTVV
ncbi:CoA-transferase [Oceanicola sp. 22II-s10i]|uniref:CaiB/BaiF CoA transferase family protein n=1 Tax=Oceanicola sp. 22II-s10i TaxID=1317116 RepID=UPI000B520B74|nr:CoA transferase [Oceanicola sp. 22II-s10i]OWU84613.1 CoA-transferase [Oceanicola sp. 22II-s10i]